MYSRILDLRLAAGLSQDELADVVGVTRRVIGCWERGERAPRMTELNALAKALHVTPNDLCGWYDTRTRTSDLDLPGDEADLLSCYRACDLDRRRELGREARRLCSLTRAENMVKKQ